jgi:hypothetical protein
VPVNVAHRTTVVTAAMTAAAIPTATRVEIPVAARRAPVLVLIASSPLMRSIGRPERRKGMASGTVVLGTDAV